MSNPVYKFGDANTQIYRDDADLNKFVFTFRWTTQINLTQC